MEFLALLTSHIPQKYESITRYYGHYSCRLRGKRDKATSNQIEPLPEPISPPSRTWAACMKRVLELDPLECPQPSPEGYGWQARCKSEMWIVAFLNNSREIKKIMESLGIPAPEPPTKIPNKNDLFSEIVDPTYDEF